MTTELRYTYFTAAVLNCFVFAFLFFPLTDP